MLCCLTYRRHISSYAVLRRCKVAPVVVQLPHSLFGFSFLTASNPASRLCPTLHYWDLHTSARRKLLVKCILTLLSSRATEKTDMSGVKKFMHKIKEKMESHGEGHSQDHQSHTEKVGGR